jgi:tryptophan synthase alpha chain
LASNLSRVFRRNEKAFIPFVTAGHPDLETTLEIIMSLARAGSAVIEIGIPFSDPVADGPIIQKSSFAALRHGYGISDYVELVRQVRSQSDVGLIFMTYLNPVLRYGLRRLDRDASAAGLDGILISDLTPEEYLLLSRLGDVSRPESSGAGSEERADDGLFQELDTVFLAAPTSSEERIRLISDVSTGFVYLIARTGVTGKKTEIDENLCQSVEKIRVCTDLPIAVGFGIRSRSDVEKVWQYADAAVVGSAIVQFVDENQSSVDLPERVADYVKNQLMPAK